MAKKIGKAAMDQRINKIAKLLATGATRSDCMQFGAKEWGIGTRSVDTLIARARDILRDDWEIDRRTFTAELLSQLATLQQEARLKGHGHIALGCINSAAKLAQLIN